MKYWFTSNTDKLWLNIEKEVTKGYDLVAMSVAHNLFPKVSIPSFLTIKGTLAAWKHALNKTQHAKELAHIQVPLRVIDYCKARMSINSLVNQGFKLYANLSNIHYEVCKE